MTWQLYITGFVACFLFFCAPSHFFKIPIGVVVLLGVSLVWPAILILFVFSGFAWVLRKPLMTLFTLLLLPDEELSKIDARSRGAKKIRN